MLTYKLSQDHIENLFSKIRAKGGFNNNPDVRCFQSALKSLLIYNQITPSPNANCLDIMQSSNDNSCILLLKPNRSTKEPDEDHDDELLPVQETLNVELTKPVTDIVEYIGMYLPYLTMSVTE
jgi:hypothetical protein